MITPLLSQPCLIQRGRNAALVTRLQFIPLPSVSQPTGGPVITKGEAGPKNNASSDGADMAGPAVAPITENVSLHAETHISQQEQDHV